jgi:hypothetical protein
VREGGSEREWEEEDREEVKEDRSQVIAVHVLAHATSFTFELILFYFRNLLRNLREVQLTVPWTHRVPSPSWVPF